MAKEKYYVVWQGLNPGIYESWAVCKAQVVGQPRVKYKSFGSREEALKAFVAGPDAYLGPDAPKKASESLLPKARVMGQPEPESLAVDAACSGNPGDMEYRGVYVATGHELFRVGPFKRGTNNIGEFLAIVHGLALLKKEGSDLPLYSDSRNAILWVRQKKCRTRLERVAENEPIFNLIERAEKWLNENSYETRLLKWETAAWGEIPADFHRK